MNAIPVSRGVFVMLAFWAVFFMLVALFLGPDLIKQRTENAAWFMTHIIGGSLVLLLGPFQFLPFIRNRFRRYHRVAGYTYVVATLVALVGFIGLMPPRSNVFLPSQMVVAILWLACVLLAVRAIRRGNILSHQHNMARSFVLAAYFLSVRLLDRHGMFLLAPLVDSADAKLAHSDWLAWFVPLAFVELYFGLKWEAATNLRSKRTAVVTSARTAP